MMASNQSFNELCDIDDVDTEIFMFLSDEQISYSWKNRSQKNPAGTDVVKTLVWWKHRCSGNCDIVETLA